MKKLIFGLLLCFPLLGLAQNEMQTINSIKSDNDYLYATGTSTVSEEDATGIARELIRLEIEQWLKEQSVDDVAGYIAKSKDCLSQINTRRGNLYRVFVYVKKTNIMSYKKGENVIVVDLQNTQTQTQPQMQPQTPTPVAVQPSFVPTAQEQRLLAISTFSELNDYINQGRQSGEIISVGNYKNLPASGTCYVFIHNREGMIPAHIKWQDSNTVNMQTGLADNVSDYKGCGAIWIKIKSE
jgi:hypothetical protein